MSINWRHNADRLEDEKQREAHSTELRPTARYDDTSLWFRGYLNEPPLIGAEAAIYLGRLLDGVEGEALDMALRSLDGHFAFVLKSKTHLLATVDRIRSTPLFWGLSGGKVVIDDRAVRLRDRLALSECEEEGALSISMAGYTIGEKTLYKGLHQLRAGQAMVANGDKYEVRTWYQYRPWLVNYDADDPRLVRDATQGTLRVFEKLARSLDGRLALVPLSAGLDSRLVAAGLRQVGYRNVHCFSYGIPGNYEAAASRRVAHQLGYPWFFLPLSHSEMASHYNSQRHAEYLEFADTCLSVPVEHEYAACAQLRERGWGREAIIINGQSGDYLTGGHVPKEMVAVVSRDNDQVARRNAVLDAIVAKHFSLWEGLKTSETIPRIRDMIWTEIARVDPFSRPATVDYALIEWLEWETRQSRYVVTNQRIYEFFEFDWRLPLWDTELLDFWQGVPVQAKLGQALYKKVLTQANWGGVWEEFSAKRWVSPRWHRFVRPILKVTIGSLGGKENWRRFDKRYLAYWNDVQAKIAVADWVTVSQDRRGWRSAISWLAEKYLERHRLGWQGRQLV